METIMIYIEGYFVSGVFAVIMLKASYPDALSSVYHHFSVRFHTLSIYLCFRILEYQNYGYKGIKQLTMEEHMSQQ